MCCREIGNNTQSKQLFLDYEVAANIYYNCCCYLPLSIEMETGTRKLQTSIDDKI